MTKSTRFTYAGRTLLGIGIYVGVAILPLCAWSRIGTLGLTDVRAQETPTVWDAVYTVAQADRGAVVYKKECASCHGEGLNGVDEAPGLAGATFLSNWNGQSVGDLVDLTRKSMPKDNETTLTRQQYVDITAHVLRVNGFPAGETELPVAALRLGTIRIDAFRK
jgi:mono/diheme cytochrome c family protein